ncbi:MAG: sulfurtransferase [Tissierellaceae bacterium]
MKNIVTASWLKDNLESEDLAILDIRNDYEDYHNQHIKGAQFVSLDEVAAGKLSTHGGRHPLPNLDKFIEDMKDLGVGDGTRVVIYDDGDISRAGRLWWLLKYIGKDEVYVLEGGMDGWVSQRGEISRELPQVNKATNLTKNIRKEMKVDMEYVREIIHKDNVALVDARAYERFIGKVEPLDFKAGHIPGAMNCPWEDLIKDGEILPVERLEEKFRPFKDYDELIVYCGSGITATVLYILMEEVGLEPKMYAGSFSDWISYDDNEILP